ncbi:MAG: tetratricopeptide repeat-containing diguanylate cyclase [Acidobacteriota bacterium]
MDSVAAMSDPMSLLRECEQSFRLNHYAEALDLATRALALFRLGDDKPGEALALGWAGGCLTQQSRYQEAIENLKDGIALCEQLGRMDLAGRAFNYLAIVFEELGDTERAIEVYEQGLTVVRAVGQTELEGRLLANLGDLYVTMGDYAKAFPMVEMASELLKARGEDALYGWCLWAIARIHDHRGEDATARDYFERSLVAAEKGGALRTQAEVRTGLGSLLVKGGDYEGGVAQLYRALDLAEQAGVRREIFKTQHALAEAHEKFGRHEDALRHFKAFHQVRSEMYDEVAKAKVSSLAAAMELERERLEREMSRLRNIELAEALRQLELQAEELRRLTTRDALTGVFNRRYLDEVLPGELERCRRYRTPFSLAMADVDHFKQVNDTLSHAVGDQVLRRLAELMTTELRQSDLMARYGGEEFVLAFPETALIGAIEVCERMRKAIEGHAWSAIHPELQVRISFGVVGDQGAMGRGSLPDWERLLLLADTRLYEAKQNGRNRVCG